MDLHTLILVKEDEDIPSHELHRLAREAADMQINATRWSITAGPVEEDVDPSMVTHLTTPGVRARQFVFETDRPSDMAVSPGNDRAVRPQRDFHES